MQTHYFDKPEEAESDTMLEICIKQGYVPITCLLNGHVVFSEINEGHDPCKGCEGPRNICKGRSINNI